MHNFKIGCTRSTNLKPSSNRPDSPVAPRCELLAMRSMTVVCASQQVNGIDLESVDVGLAAALCCCTASLLGLAGCAGRTQGSGSRDPFHPLVHGSDGSPRSLRSSDRQNVVYAAAVMPRSRKRVCMPMRRVS